MGLTEKLISAAKAEVVGHAVPEANGLPTDIGGLRVLIRTMLGQPTMPTGTAWPMSNNRSATRLSALEPEVEKLRTDLDAIQLTPGPQGPEGPQGPKGNTGAKGTAGETGPQGLKGDTGAAGPQGAKGDAGAVGATGQQGAKGDTGAQGAVGLTGATGAKGDAGPQGPIGADLTNPRIRTKRVPTPAMLLSTNPVVNVVWDTPFADNNYTLQATLQSTNSGLLGLIPTVTGQTKEGATVTLKVLISLAAGAGTVHFTAIHD